VNTVSAVNVNRTAANMNFLFYLLKPNWLLLLCRATPTNQALVDREESSYYYLPLSPRISTSITAISSPILYVDGNFTLF